jgi:iron complex outermembrane recepter protein
MAHHPHFRLAFVAAAAAACAAAASAQTSTVTITGRAVNDSPSLAGFGDIPLARSPLQAAVYGTQQLDDAGITAFDGLARLDASLSDAYNTEGYWSSLTARGFVLDQRFNYRRDGLPISAETFISLANKDRIEVLKGTSGIQAGTSAPGGLVNFVVKRPTTDLRSASLAWTEDATLAGAVDISQRFGADRRFGLRVNAEAARLRPQMKNADGSRRALAVAADWQPTAGSVLEFEAETSTRSQPSAPGFSLLGERVPDPKSIDPRTNLNNQPWSLPVMLHGDTASLRWQQALGAGWHFVAHGATQRLKSDDRVAFPFGCSAENVFDRYCSDGTFDLYDFRSDDERRRIDALDVHVDGRFATGAVRHRMTVGWLTSRTHDVFGPQAFNYAGVGHVEGTLMVAPAPDASGGSERRERSREAYWRDVMSFGDAWELWAGLRATRIERDGLAQSFTTPWLALSWAVAPGAIVYASWGQGVESEGVPNREAYTNAGAALTERSRQAEAGVKLERERWHARAALFDIRRPLANDFCNSATPVACTRALDGAQRHRGIELAAGWNGNGWRVDASAMHIDAKREDALVDPSTNGLAPTNVPATTLRVQSAYDVAAGLALQAGLAAESSREVLPDNSVSIPGWWRLDLGARWRTQLAGQAQTWRVGVDNATDRRAWREAPYQFGHAYLFPLQPRTWRASVSSSF